MRSLFNWGIQGVREKYEFCSFRLGEPPARRDLAVTSSLEHNRSVKMMEKINKVVNWQNTYLKLTNLNLGFLLNWNVPLMKDGIKRMVKKLKE